MKAADGGQLYLSGKSADYEKDGSYIVFEAENGSEVIYIKSERKLSWIWTALILLFVIAAVTVIFLTVMKRRYSKRK